MANHHRFRVGQVVEVGNAGDDGFMGSWYVGTIVDRSPAEPPLKNSTNNKKEKEKEKEKEKLLVEYQTLLDELDDSKPLREYVDPILVRPHPPPAPPQEEENGDRGVLIQVGEEVEAYYNDGWWEGTITQVMENKMRYGVYFMDSGEEMEFGKSELRIRRDWVGGKWFLPQQLQTSGARFNRGSLVEVRLHDEHCRDGWFPATVLKRMNDNFIVEMQYIAGKLKKTIDSFHIRPIPPNSSPEKSFNLLEKVDAFFDNGWWNGVIRRVLAGHKYIVFFKHRNEQKEFTQSELRCHMDWIDGKWFKDSKEIPVTAHKQGQPNSSVQTQFRAAEKNNFSSPPSGDAVAKKDQSTCKSDLLTPCKKLKTIEAKSPRSLKHCHARRMSPKDEGTAVDGRRAKSQSLPEFVPKHTLERHNMDHPGPLHSSDGQQPHGGKSKDSSNHPSVEERTLGLTIGMEQNNIADFPKRRLKLKIRTPRQKTGPLISNTEALVRGDQQNPAGGRSQVAGNTIETQAKGPEQAKANKGTIDCSAIQRDDVVKEIQIDAASSNNSDLPQPLSMWVDESVLPLDTDGNGVSSNDQPTSQLIKAITRTDSPIRTPELQKSSTIVVGSTLMVGGTTTDTQLVEEIGDTVNECVLQSIQLDPSPRQLLLMSESCPFMKQSPSWEVVDTLKVFEVMPQRPHFRPLEQYRMDFREGHAIGATLNFANLVEKICDRKVDEPTRVLQEMLEALPKFVALGFNVEPIQTRLKDMLQTKNKHGQLYEEFMAAEEHFNKDQYDEEELEVQLDTLANKIKGLKQSLQTLKQERESTAMQKQIKNLRISELKNKVDTTKRRIPELRRGFDSVVSAPWGTG